MVKQSVYHHTFLGQPDEVFDAIQKRLSESELRVLKVDVQAKAITVEATVKLVDWVFWRCYGDKVVFRCTRLRENETDVSVYGIPNLLKIGIRRGQKVLDLTEATRTFEGLLWSAVNDAQPIAQTTGSG
jgi:hypothetical protein